MNDALSLLLTLYGPMVSLSMTTRASFVKVIIQYTWSIDGKDRTGIDEVPLSLLLIHALPVCSKTIDFFVQIYQQITLLILKCVVHISFIRYFLVDETFVCMYVHMYITYVPCYAVSCSESAVWIDSMIGSSRYLQGRNWVIARGCRWYINNRKDQLIHSLSQSVKFVAPLLETCP